MLVVAVHHLEEVLGRGVFVREDETAQTDRVRHPMIEAPRDVG